MTQVLRGRSRSLHLTTADYLAMLGATTQTLFEHPEAPPLAVRQPTSELTPEQYEIARNNLWQAAAWIAPHMMFPYLLLLDHVARHFKLDSRARDHVAAWLPTTLNDDPNWDYDGSRVRWIGQPIELGAQPENVRNIDTWETLRRTLITVSAEQIADLQLDLLIPHIQYRVALAPDVPGVALYAAAQLALIVRLNGDWEQLEPLLHPLLPTAVRALLDKHAPDTQEQFLLVLARTIADADDHLRAIGKELTTATCRFGHECAAQLIRRLLAPNPINHQGRVPLLIELLLYAGQQTVDVPLARAAQSSPTVYRSEYGMQVAMQIAAALGRGDLRDARELLEAVRPSLPFDIYDDHQPLTRVQGPILNLAHEIDAVLALLEVSVLVREAQHEAAYAHLVANWLLLGQLVDSDIDALLAERLLPALLVSLLPQLDSHHPCTCEMITLGWMLAEETRGPSHALSHALRHAFITRYRRAPDRRHDCAGRPMGEADAATAP